MLRRPARQRSEAGSSLVLALTVVMLIGLLGAVMVDRSLSNARNARLEQDRAAALQAAEVGVAEATARITRGESASFAAAGSTGTGVWSIRATLDAAYAWTVIASGQASNAQRSISSSVIGNAGAWQVSDWRQRAVYRPYADQVLATSGLVGFWRLGERAGTVAADTFGTRPGSYLNGTVLGGVGRTPGDVDGSAVFDGANDRVAITGSPGLSTYSVAAWVFPTGIVGDWQSVVGRNGGSDPNLRNVGIWLSPTTGEILCQHNGAGGWTQATGPAVALNQWSHVAVTFDGATMRCYLNGAQVASTAGTAPHTPSDGVISIGNNLLHQTVNGRIDDAAVWSRALSAGEMTALYNAGI